MDWGYDLSHNEPAPVATNPVRPTTNKAASWSDWMGKPENRAMFLQAGINMLQGPGSGGGGIGGQIGAAVGAGMEARDRVIQGGRDQQEKERSAGLEERRVQAAEVSAGSRQVKGASTTQKTTRWISALSSYINEQVKNLPFDQQERTAAQLLAGMKESGELDQLYQVFSQYGELPATGGSAVPVSAPAGTAPPVPGASPNVGIGTTTEVPPVAGAKKAPDGNWYVQQNGVWNKVVQ